jgi:hypothetical protein
MQGEKGYLIGMVESKIHRDALLLRGVRNFSTANDNVRGNTAATLMTTQPATARQRDDNAFDLP